MPRPLAVTLLICVGLLTCLGLWLPEPAAAETLVLSHLGNDQATGQAFHILQEAYRRLGIEVREELLPHERSLRAANAGETDGEVMRMAGIEAQYPDLVRVPEPVVTFDAVAFTTGLAFQVDGWESLRPYPVCINRGMKMAEQGTEGMNRMFGTSVEQIIEMLRRGHCLVAVLGRFAWLEFDRLDAGPIRELEPPIASLPLFHYVNRRHAALVPKLAETLRQMRRDGTTAAIIAIDQQPIAAARQRNSLPGQ